MLKHHFFFFSVQGEEWKEAVNVVMIYKIQLAQPDFTEKHKCIKETHVIPGDIPETGREQNGFRHLKLQDTENNFF